uniref:NADH dehydrogenase subunit 1 n=1 Tax=Pyura mirabilis TaxID=111863 RepID=UPI002551DE40|nr:NADH dehydrogenase subunit 1 [Pyura mirabilis]UPP55930.1 NADH dehydrogenase subunit 1 [Pyura mirabilis]
MVLLGILYVYLGWLILIYMLMLLLLVAFLVLLERKVLGMVQARKGPNIVGLFGMVQTILDGVKLLTKKFVFSGSSMFFYIAPFMGLMLAFIHWFVVPFPFNFWNSEYSVIFSFVIMGFLVFVVLWAGWGSESGYGLIGSVRGVAQMISYEVVFMFYLCCFVLVMKGYNWDDFLGIEMYVGTFLKLFLFIVWVVLILAELNRTPFDLVEGESELVSGFNVEFSGYSFTLLFLSEYMNIWFMCVLSALIFGECEGLFGGILWGAYVMCILLVRGLLPRFKFNQLIKLMWGVYLPVVFIFMIVVLVFFSG